MCPPTAELRLDGRADWITDLSEPVRELGLLAQDLTFWKTERLDVMSLGDFQAAELYDAAARVLSIEPPDLFAMTRSEIELSLKSGEPAVHSDRLAERRAGFCLLLSDGDISFYHPSREASRSTSDDDETLLDEGAIQGIAASRGVATGRVRVLLDPEAAAELRPGEVLVTDMTRPEMGAALERAVAFVTDQGGMMSHAAIISRELGKPCVIGTEIGTRRLTDGMLVTVNGDDGTVLILAEEAEL